MTSDETRDVPEAHRGRVALLERRHELPGDLSTAGEARRLVRRALAEAARDDWSDAAELAVSEVVTNAVLHAHSDVELAVRVFDDEVCVEVRDFNAILPVQRSYEVEATTGRGMGLVGAVAQSCGVHSLGESGKIVWFCVGDQAASHDVDDVLAAWDIDELLDDGAKAEMCDVVLRSMPATLWLSARQHHDALIRELVLYVAEHPGIEVDISAADRARATISTALVSEIDQARAAGAAAAARIGSSGLPWVPTAVDLRLQVRSDAGGEFAALQDTLDAAERLAVDGDLLMRPGLPEIVAVRDWACEQVIAQLAGAAASPWPGTDQARFERDVRDRVAPAEPEWDRSIVTDADVGVVAADDANRIVAVSRSLASLLGWEPDELVGRRVVTMVPHAWREAHVAGFSRHLSTGETHILGTPLELPMLRRDGSEVQCTILIERAPVSTGRAVYLAWIEPLQS